MKEKSQNNERSHQAPALKVTVAKIAQLPAVTGINIFSHICKDHVDITKDLAY